METELQEQEYLPASVTELYEEFFVAYLEKRGIDARAGSGPEVLRVLKDALGTEVPAGREQELIANLRLMAETMADNLLAHDNRLHETSLRDALRKLCPLWPFYKTRQ